MNTDLNTSSTTLTSLAKLGESLAKAQSEFKAPAKKCKVDFTDKNGRRVKYNYADLADVIDAIRSPLAKNGLSIIHQLGYSKDMYGLTTTLLHSSGELVVTWYPLPDPLKQQIKPQEFGAALTYARRYSLSSIVGIASDEDSDAADGAPTEPPRGRQSNSNPKPHNYAPQGPPPGDDLDAALGGEPPDFDNLPPHTLLDELVSIVESKGIPHEEMASIIKRATGSSKRSKELSDAELSTVIAFIKMMKK